MQQVNLYQDRFREIEVELPAKKLAVFICGLLVVMTLSSFYLAWSNNTAMAKREVLQRELDSLKAQNQTALAKLQSQNVDPVLEKSVNNTMKQLRARQRIMDWVNASQSETAVAFSVLLEGLGRQRVDGLWLSNIEIFNGGSDLDLQGSTLDPQLLPTFIGKLREEPVYVGREFRRVAMLEDGDSNIINFRITTEKAGDDKMPALATINGSKK